MDVAAIAAGVTAARHAVDLAKGLTESFKSSGKASIEEFTKLQIATLDVLAKQQELALQLQEARARIKELENASSLAENLEYWDEAYWRKPPGENDRAKWEGPFCQTCFDRDQRVCRLQVGKIADAKWQCSVCKSIFFHGKQSSEQFSAWQSA